MEIVTPTDYDGTLMELCHQSSYSSCDIFNAAYLGPGCVSRGVWCCRMEIITPKDYVGTLMELCQVRRGEFMDMQFMTESRTTLVYEMPLALVSPPEVISPRLVSKATEAENLLA